jgi:two-component system, chemotaxis family, CheB/CheR fusion protein
MRENIAEDQAAPDPSQIAFPVVGIGASAGGLEAVSELLSALPASTGMAFVLVQHLDPSRASMLVEILGKKTALPVAEARDGMRLAADRLYVIPPNASLTVAGNLLRLAAREGNPPGPIDALFRSLAAERGRAAVGVLLSGASSDGTRGARAIKEAGGVVMAQAPESAAFAIMPRSAIDAGAVDAVLRPAEIAGSLARLAEHLARHEDETPDAAAPEDELWKRIFRLLHGAGGIDFTHYKRSTIQRRIARRQALRHVAELGQYAALLSEDSAELNTLAQDVLIGVTSFFRDPESFEALAQAVFPALLERRAPRDPLRIWVPGCATGEELYSIAMCLMEHLGEGAARTPIQLFGTDASEAAIARAREGSYPEGIEAEVSSERLSRWFVKVNHHYRIAKPLRELCVFARHDVTRDPPFSRVDLISCRNLLIYLDAGLQRQVIEQFHYALNPRGFLLLGPSEAIGASADLFELADKKRRLLMRRDVAGRARAHSARAPAPRAAWEPKLPRPAALEADPVQREADRMLLARYAPAAIVVDEDLNVHQFRGQTGAYLEHASGAASLNLQQLAPPGLLFALTPALREARTAHAAVRRDVRLETRGRARSVSFEVSPLRMQDGDSGACYLVVFEEPGRRTGLWERLLEAAARRTPAPGSAAGDLETLKHELAATREFLRSSAEEHEAAKEELKSLHEEALSSNEELQSTNEELETAKEELQSTNEELATTNDELRTRNEQLHDAIDALTAARDFAEAIVEATRHPLLVLDRRLRVQSANAAFYRLFRVDPGDTKGELLYDLGNRQWDIPDLRRLLEETLSKSEFVEDYRVTQRFEGLGERIMLLYARRLGGRKGESELILLGVEDATERLSAAAVLEEADRKKDEFLAMLGHELRNPLAPVRGVLDVMRTIDIRDETLRWAREVLDRQTGQMVRLVDDLLEMSRIARGRLTLDLAEMALGDAMARAIEAARPLIEARKHRLKLEQPPQPIRLRGDLVRLTQLFTNLLINAAKYTPPGGEIRVAIAAGDADAAVIISDNGDGIAPERLPRIFEPFAQSGTVSRTGLGIGLPLAHRLAELHRGTIEAKSEGPGKGSAFTVRLPRLAGTQPVLAPSPRHTGKEELDGCRVLVVDDNADAADSLRVLLEFSGGEVRCVYDGASAVPVAEEFRPEVVLLDLGLPDIDGYEVLRRLRAAPGIKPAVVALTGYAQPADVERMEQAGFDHHLRKPADGSALVALIASLRRRK